MAHPDSPCEMFMITNTKYIKDAGIPAPVCGTIRHFFAVRHYMYRVSEVDLASRNSKKGSLHPTASEKSEKMKLLCFPDYDYVCYFEYERVRGSGTPGPLSVSAP